MNEHTPTTADVRQQYKALAHSRPLGITYTSALKTRGAEFDRWLAAHDAEVRAGVVAEEPEWDGTEYGYVDFEHGLIPLVHGYEEITHERQVRYGPWVPVKQEGAET